MRLRFLLSCKSCQEFLIATTVSVIFIVQLVAENRCLFVSACGSVHVSRLMDFLKYFCPLLSSGNILFLFVECFIIIT